MAPETTLRLCDVPDDWFEDPEALGYVAVRVLTEGKATLATPVARSLLAGLRSRSPAASAVRRGSAWRGCTWPGEGLDLPSNRPGWPTWPCTCPASSSTGSPRMNCCA